MPTKPLKKPTPESPDPWQDWGKRVKVHIKQHKLRWPHIAESMNMEGASGSGVRHWTNGTRDINLNDFFRLCKVIEADPAVMLFSGPVVPADAPDNVKEAIHALLRKPPPKT